jgi:hypothetical protein
VALQLAYALRADVVRACSCCAQKFLVGPDGAPVKRYSRYFPTGDIAADIDALL